MFFKKQAKHHKYMICIFNLHFLICYLPCVQGRKLRQPNSGGGGAGKGFEGTNLWAGGPRERAGQPEVMAGGEHQTPKPRSHHQCISFNGSLTFFFFSLDCRSKSDNSSCIKQLKQIIHTMLGYNLLTMAYKKSD